MARQQETEIPVYVFMGFLDSGKTTFVKETLLDREFTGGAKTLLLVCEDGEEEYDEKDLKKKNIFLEFIEEDQLNTEHLLDLQDKYQPEQVMIEYNGMWKLDKIFDIRVPKGWTVVQVLSFVNAETYDVKAEVIELNDEDFGIWYVDASDQPDRYVGKKIHFRGMVFKPKQYGKNAFVPGRFAMTCCVEDITFVGFKCYYDGSKNLVDRQWVDVTATIKKEYYPDFEGDGPVLYAEKVVLTGPPEEEVVYFS